MTGPHVIILADSVLLLVRGILHASDGIAFQYRVCVLLVVSGQVTAYLAEPHGKLLFSAVLTSR